MNIYAMKGHKVRCKTLDAGYDYQIEMAKAYLQINAEYVVERTIVCDWHTNVYLQEFPNTYFNSVFFEDVSEQDEETSMKHPDRQRFRKIVKDKKH